MKGIGQRNGWGMLVPLISVVLIVVVIVAVVVVAVGGIDETDNVGPPPEECIGYIETTATCHIQHPPFSGVDTDIIGVEARFVEATRTDSLTLVFPDLGWFDDDVEHLGWFDDDVKQKMVFEVDNYPLNYHFSSEIKWKTSVGIGEAWVFTKTNDNIWVADSGDYQITVSLYQWHNGFDKWELVDSESTTVSV
jgi:hypothetical protein